MTVEDDHFFFFCAWKNQMPFRLFIWFYRAGVLLFDWICRRKDARRYLLNRWIEFSARIGVIVNNDFY